MHLAEDVEVAAEGVGIVDEVVCHHLASEGVEVGLVNFLRT